MFTWLYSAICLLSSCFVLLLFFFILPVSIPIFGFYFIKKRHKSNKNIVLPIVIISVAEIIALIPDLTLIFDEDHFYFFATIAGMLFAAAIILPIVFPIVSILYLRNKRKTEKLKISKVVFFIVLEIIFILIVIGLATGYLGEFLVMLKNLFK